MKEKDNDSEWAPLRKAIEKDIIQTYFGRCEKILEIGFGSGSFLEVCKDLKKKCFGIDIDKDKINSCKNRGLNVRYGRIDKIPFPTNFFDGVYASHVLEHCKNDFKAMKEIRRVLKTGGVLVLRVPTPGWWFYVDITHFGRPYTKQSIQQLLHMFKFRIIEVEEEKYGFVGLRYICRKLGLYNFYVKVVKRFRIHPNPREIFVYAVKE